MFKMKVIMEYLIVSSPEQTIHQNSAPGVHMDEERSSKTGDVLYLYDIDLTSEGSYKCEVSADYTFQTVKLESYLTVIGKSNVCFKMKCFL
jgi:hypothetical protein